MGFLAQSKKAVAAGTAAAAAAFTTSLSSALVDGKVEQPEIITIVTATVAGFLLGFAATWAAPANAPKPVVPDSSADVPEPAPGENV